MRYELAIPTGIGQVPPSVTAAIGAGTAITSGLLATTAGGTSILATLIPSAAVLGPAAPFIALAGVVAELIIGLLGKPNEYKIATTNVVNKLEPYFQQNVNTWLALPASQKTVSAQAAALAVFDQLWAAVEEYCNQVGSNNIPGSSGSGPDAAAHCINDRSEGSCVFKTAIPVGWSGNGFQPSLTTSGWNVWNGNNGKQGNCWNWWIGYHDPIANDPNVIPDPVQSTVSNVASALGIGGSSMFLILGAALLGLALLSEAT